MRQDSWSPESKASHSLADVIDDLAHLLPAQGPISVFIHHNTLHAFEHLPFERAVVDAGELFGCEPFLSLDAYRDALRRGRIRDQDLQRVLRDDLGPSADDPVGSYATRFAIRLAMLRRSARSARGAELRWFLVEADTLERLRPDLDDATRERLLARSPVETAGSARRRERAAV